MDKQRVCPFLVLINSLLTSANQGMFNACPVTCYWWHRSGQRFVPWHGWRGSGYLWFSLAKRTVVLIAQPMASPCQRYLLTLVGFCTSWDGLFYVSRTEYNNYGKNKVRGRSVWLLTFCVRTDKVFSEVAWFIFPSQLPLLQHSSLLVIQ